MVGRRLVIEQNPRLRAQDAATATATSSAFASVTAAVDWSVVGGGL